MKDHDFTRNKLFVDRSVPSKLTDRIYLSGFDATNHPYNLKSLGITAIVNLTPEANGCDGDEDFAIYQVPIDDGTALPVYLVHEFIEVMKVFEATNKTVLIHCHAGISRTSSFAIAWLMHKRGCNAQSDLRTIWSECEDEVRAARSIILPHYLLKRAVLQYFAEV